MKTIELTQGYVSLVDDADHERLSQWHWQAMCKRTRNGERVCAIRTERTPRTKKRTVYMHREVLSAPDHLQVDHVNGDPLDNRRENLRICTNQQNQANVRKRWSGTSEFKGVHCVPTGKWVARIGVGYRRIALGSYGTEIEAARAYDRAARKYFGAFALLNLPDEPTDEELERQEIAIARGVRALLAAGARRG